MSVVLLVFLLVFLLLSAFFSASETALFSLTSSKRASFSKSSHRGKNAASILLKRPRSLLITILMMNISVNIGFQNMISSIFGLSSGMFFNVIIPFILTLLFGEILPKIIAITKSESISSMISIPILFFSKALSPFRYIFVKITNCFASIFSLFLTKDRIISKEEVKHTVKASEKMGIMTKDETKLLLGSLRLSEIQVKDVMCPRQNIYSYDINDSIDSLRELFTKKRLSKIPVINKTVDDVLGVINASSFFSVNHMIDDAKSLKNELDNPFFAPENMPCKTLLSHFNKRKIDISLIVDEYGSISGLATKEDLVEVIVGQIRDERDEKTLFTRQGDDVIICSGKYELNDLEQLFDIELTRRGTEATVGGYLLEILGDIPETGYKVKSENLFFHVLLSSDTKVSRVYIKHLGRIKLK